MSAKCFTVSDIPTDLAETYEDVVRRIYLEVWSPENEFKTGDTVDSIAKRLNSVIDRATAFTGMKSGIQRELFAAEALVAWIRSNMEYWSELNSKPGRERVEWNKATNVLSHTPRPKGNCDGYTKLAVALAKPLGVRCVEIGGHLRNDDGQMGSHQKDTKFIQGIPWNHGWNVFIIGEKFLPADITGAYNYRDVKFRTAYLGKTDSAFALPMHTAEWELFLAKHRMLQWDGKPVDYQDPFTKLSLAAWKETSYNYVKLRAQMRDRDIARNKALSRSSK